MFQSVRNRARYDSSTYRKSLVQCNSIGKKHMLQCVPNRVRDQYLQEKLSSVIFYCTKYRFQCVPNRVRDYYLNKKLSSVQCHWKKNTCFSACRIEYETSAYRKGLLQCNAIEKKYMFQCVPNRVRDQYLQKRLSSVQCYWKKIRFSACRIEYDTSAYRKGLVQCNFI